MLKQEFEVLAHRRVSAELYKTIEELYMASALDKTEFVKSIKPLLKSIPEPEKKQYFMVVHNSVGECKTPNGCYFLTVKVTIEKTDIKKGKIHLRKIPNSFEMVGYPSGDLVFNDWDRYIVIDE